jgi:hypothetical protein
MPVLGGAGRIVGGGAAAGELAEAEGDARGAAMSAAAWTAFSASTVPAP